VSLTRVGVVGLGLIGGSIVRRLAELPDLYEPIGFDVKNEPRAGLALADSLETLARDAELVIVAVPPHHTAGVVAAVLAADQNVLVTDVASVKKPIVDEVGSDDRYLPSHPLAGAETTGWHAARADLLLATTWAVCPSSPAAPAAPLCRWAKVFDAFDARLIVCDALEHDVAVARTSHAPHLIATAMAAALGDQPSPRLAAALSGGAFRDVARLASSDHALWGEIIDLNGDNVAAAVADLRAALDEPSRWEQGRQVAELVHALRWQEPTWERRDFDWPAWDELLQLGRQGTAIRHPEFDGERLSADVAVPATS
jgi:prephenate dehydrogenase